LCFGHFKRKYYEKICNDRVVAVDDDGGKRAEWTNQYNK
jgi:hypothetical protein